MKALPNLPVNQASKVVDGRLRIVYPSIRPDYHFEVDGQTGEIDGRMNERSTNYFP